MTLCSFLCLQEADVVITSVCGTLIMFSKFFKVQVLNK